jgi:hypothetical protein
MSYTSYSLQGNTLVNEVSHGVEFSTAGEFESSVQILHTSICLSSEIRHRYKQTNIKCLPVSCSKDVTGDQADGCSLSAYGRPSTGTFNSQPVCRKFMR